MRKEIRYMLQEEHGLLQKRDAGESSLRIIWYTSQGERQAHAPSDKRKKIHVSGRDAVKCATFALSN